jgi:hypothetical protein
MGGGINSKFEIRNSKDLAQEARIVRIFFQGVRLTHFELLISNFEFIPPHPSSASCSHTLRCSGLMAVGISMPMTT